MDLSVLPALYALTIFVCCFRPLVRRAGPHTNVWFAGWALLLFHYALLLVPSRSGWLGTILNVLLLWSVEACALCFLWAAAGARRTPFKRFFVLEVGLAISILSVLYTLDTHSYPARLGAVLLLLVPAIHLISVRKHRTRHFNRLAVGFAVVALGLVPLARADAYLSIGIILGAIFLSTAYMVIVHADPLTRGVSLMVIGLSLWAISCPLQAFDVLLPTAMVSRAILDLPRYILAAGTILSFLDDYVGQTERLALHDPLTGLPNRRLFESRLDAAIEESRLTRTPVACLVIDVDNFKHINDTLGHPVGDGLLQALAKRLSWNLGPRDLLARTGGDEFTAVLVEAADEFHIRFIAGAMMAAGCVPVSIQEHAINVRISIGVAVSPQDAGTSSELHKAADDAMYRAKRRGGSIVAFVGEETAQIHAV